MMKDNEGTVETFAQNVSSSRPKIEEAIKTTTKSAIYLLIAAANLSDIVNI